MDNQSPEEIQALAEKIKDKLGPDFNYARLRGAAESLPGVYGEVLSRLAAEDQINRQPIAPAEATAALIQPKPQPEVMGELATQAGFFNPLLESRRFTAYYKQGGLEFAKQQMNADMQARYKFMGDVLQQFGHDMTLGIVSPPTTDPKTRLLFDTVVKPALSLAEIGIQGSLIIKGLKGLAKVPAAATLLENLSPRIREIGLGAATWAGIDVLRSEGVPEQPSTIDLSGRMARYLTNEGMHPRVALGLSGFVTGGAIGSVFAGIGEGMNKAAMSYLASTMTPETEAAIRESLKASGVTVGTNATKVQLISKVAETMAKITQNKGTASAISELMTRQDYIAQQLMGDAGLVQGSPSARLVSAIFMGNPGTVSVAKGITDPAEAASHAQKLGLKVEMVPIKRVDEAGNVSYDILMSRPGYAYTAFEQMERRTKNISNSISRALKRPEIKTLDRGNNLILLPSGEAVRGGDAFNKVAQKLKLPELTVEGTSRPDLALREAGGLINIDYLEDGFKITLPSRISQEQYQALGRIADAVGLPKVTLEGIGGKTKVIENPLGHQIQDAVTDLVPSAAKKSAITKAMISDFKKNGVFNGQAGLLSDGTPVRIIGKDGDQYKVFDNITGKRISVSQDRLTVLPSALAGELRPSNLFMTALPLEEQRAYLRLRDALQSGMDKPIKKIGELEDFAGSRGYYVRDLKGGKVQMVRQVDGTVQTYDNVASAVEAVRNTAAPIPDYTSEELAKAFGGETNLGAATGGGIPPKFGELIPLLSSDQMLSRMRANMEGIGPSAWQSLTKPMLPFALDIDKKFGTQLYPAMSNLQTQMVARQNFETAWAVGRGRGLPEGVLPLEKIKAMAGGSKADGELIRNWLEVTKGGEEEAAILKLMTPAERKAAPELRKWYNAMFNEFGVEADWIENYAPHIRELADRYGNNPEAIWKVFGGNTPTPPRGAKFFADYFRHSMMDVYEKDAFRGAVRYLQAGAGNRFMKEAMDQARDVVKVLANKNDKLAMPLANYIQAMRGYEFADQRAALAETFQTALEALPGTGSTSKVNAERFVNLMMSAVYSSTMSLRPALALRNASSSLVMIWPLFPTEYGEALGRSLTHQGFMAAVEDGAIALKQGSLFAREEAMSSLPETLRLFADKSMYLYDSADELTRGIAYWSGRMKAEKAIAAYGKAINAGESGQKVLDKLVLNSGAYIFDKPIVDEFLRKVSVDPQVAARYLGKNVSDMTNFLYGRGMQTRWVRSLPGRLFGQFATWSLWYMDYITRVPRNMIQNGYPGEAAAFIARHALANAAFIYAGKKVLNVDLGRWTAHSSIFYSGGPAVQSVAGIATLFRGLSDVTTGGEDPLAMTRVKQGSSIIWNTLPSFIPLHYAARDALRFADAVSTNQWVPAVAALLGTKPTIEYTQRHNLELMLNDQVPEFDTTDKPLTDFISAYNRGETVDIRQIPAMVERMRTATVQPQPLAPTPQPAAPPPPTKLPPMAAPVPKPTRYPGESVTPAVSRPIQH